MWDFRSRARDDFMIEQAPELNVDYLSHSWKPRDLWAARRYVQKRKKIHRTYCRLENALWRAWWRAEKFLDDFPAQKINWDKDTDITWLYGPLLSSVSIPAAAPVSQSSLQNNPSVPRKSALKRTARRWLRYLLPKSEHKRLQVDGLRNRCIVSPCQSRRSPESPEHHVHFNEIVEQCVFFDSGERVITHFTQGAFYETQCRLQQLQCLRNTMYSGWQPWQSQPLEKLTYLPVQTPTLLSQSSNFLKGLSQELDDPF